MKQVVTVAKSSNRMWKSEDIQSSGWNWLHVYPKHCIDLLQKNAWQSKNGKCNNVRVSLQRNVFTHSHDVENGKHC